MFLGFHLSVGQNKRSKHVAFAFMSNFTMAIQINQKNSDESVRMSLHSMGLSLFIRNSDERYDQILQCDRTTSCALFSSSGFSKMHCHSDLLPLSLLTHITKKKENSELHWTDNHDTKSAEKQREKAFWIQKKVVQPSTMQKTNGITWNSCKVRSIFQKSVKMWM